MLIDWLAQKYLKMAQIDAPPISINIVHSFDEQHMIEIRFLPLKASHGAVWYVEPSWIFHVNEEDPPRVKRFTVFHEAFHVIEALNVSRGNREGFHRVHYFDETLAEQFASCILMPIEMVVDSWRQHRDIKKLADIFDVPEPAAVFRLKCLHLI